MQCSECGHALPDGAKFCPECGARIEPVDVPVDDTPEPVTAETPDAPTDETPADAEPEAVAQVAGGKSPVGAVLTTIVVVLALAAAAYFLLPLWTQDPAHASVGDLFPNKAGMQWRFMPDEERLFLNSGPTVKSGANANTTLNVSSAPTASLFSSVKPVGLTLSKDSVSISHLLVGGPGNYMQFDPPMVIVKTPFRAGQKWSWKGKITSDKTPPITASAEISNQAGTIVVGGATVKSIHVNNAMKLTITDPYGMSPAQTHTLINGIDVVPHYGIVHYTWELQGGGTSVTAATLEPNFSYHPLLGYLARKPQRMNEPKPVNPMIPMAP